MKLDSFIEAEYISLLIGCLADVSQCASGDMNVSMHVTLHESASMKS